VQFAELPPGSPNSTALAEVGRVRSLVIDLGSGLKYFGVLRSLWDWGSGKFARQPRWRAFVSWQMYYRGYLGSQPGHALIQHTGPWVGDATRQVQLINGMAAGRAAALVWAPPGCGKSRFALELARRIQTGRGRWQVLFVHHDETVVREELHQLTQLKRLVLIVDDAHESPELVKLLASVSVQSSSARPVHLVCVTRTTGRAEVSRALNNVFPPGLVQELDLGRPTTQLVRSLIEQLLPKSSPMHRDTIERFVRQSYFGAVLVCTLLSRERKLPQSFQRQDLRDRVCREPLREAVEGVCPVETALRALAVYAALAPVPKASAPVRDLAAQLSGLGAERVEVLLDRVLVAGLFQEYGRARVRPVPDLLGDLILEEACLDAQGRATPYSTQLLERVFELDPSAAVANCADIGQLFGSAHDVDLVSKLILERARGIPRENKWDVMRLLQSCQPLTARRPLTVIEVASILEERGILRRNPPAGELHGIDSVEMYVCALLMSAGEVNPTALPVALRLGRDLYAAAQGDERTRQHVREQLEACCKFEVGRSSAHAHAVVETLRAWVAESDVQAATLAATLSGQFLALDVEGHHQQAHSVSFFRSPLNPVPEVWAVRDIAVDTLVRGTSHSNATVQCAAIGALERYAYHDLAPEQVPLETWRAQLAREVDLISAAIIKLVKSSSSLPVWACTELQGWLWWLQELDVLHRAGLTVLEAIPDTDAYRLWKSLHAQRLPARIVIPSELTGDAEARLHYFQSLSTLREEMAADQARELFEALDPRYADMAAWRTLWLTALAEPPRTPLHFRADAVVGEFARHHPQVAWSFVNESDALGPLIAILPMLLMELRKQDRARSSQAAREVSAGTRLEDAWLRVLWAAPDPDEAESALLARGLESADAQIRHRAAGALLHATGADRLGVFRRVFATVARHPTDAVLWELVIEQFVHWTEGALPPQLAGPTEAMVQVADELIRLFQTHGSHLRWGFQRHTRQLSNAFAILTIIRPEQLQDWMQRTWRKTEGPGAQWNDESPLGISRLAEIMRLIQDSPAASHWIDVFAQWMLRDAHLGTVGALGLGELCSLDDAKVGELAAQIGRQPTDSSVKSFAEFIHHQNSDANFAPKALGMLEVWTQFPNSYGPIENAVVYALVQGASGRTLGQPSPAHMRALEAIDARRAQGATSGLLLGTLERAGREVREAMANNVARDEESTDS
jgi:hypothetical protein